MRRAIRLVMAVALAALVAAFVAGEQDARPAQAQTFSPGFGQAVAEGDYESPNTLLGERSGAPLTGASTQ